MSQFAVEIRTISTVSPHPNAHSLQLATLDGLGYRFITGLSAVPGDVVVYFPLDSVLPATLQEHLQLDKPRIKAKKLRGIVSEGFIVPVSDILAYFAAQGATMPTAKLSGDLTKTLEVTKYDPVVFDTTKRGSGSRPDQLIALPVGVYVYDIENAGRYPNVVARLQEEMVVITEKVEGSHWWARIDADGETIHVGQRRFEIKQDTPHPWIDTFYKENLDTALAQLASYYRGYNVTLRGEIIGDGIQGNYYGLPAGQRRIYLFELEVGGTPVDSLVFGDWVGKLKLRSAPFLYVGKLKEVATDTGELTAWATGKSEIRPDLLREGIVIKPLIEKYDEELGRTMLKIRDPLYLAQ